jgi:hypothetical protein
MDVLDKEIIQTPGTTEISEQWEISSHYAESMQSETSTIKFSI